MSVDQDEPCMFCGETPRSGAWGRPCPASEDHLHYTPRDFRVAYDEKLTVTGRSLSRAAYELEKIARLIDELPPRLRRRLPVDLAPEIIRNEAERARDALHVYGLLDV